MKPIDIDFNLFDGQNHHQQSFSLSKLESSVLSFLTKKTEKIKEMNFHNKI
jgi:hypothetical protein